MAEFWTEVAKIAFAPAAIVLAAGYIVRKMIDHTRDRDLINRKNQADKELEMFRSRLESDSFKEIEQFKKTLEAEAFEHQKRVSHLLEKRAEVIAELYKRTVDMNMAVAILIDPSQLVSVDQDENLRREQERNETARQSLKKFSDYFLKNSVYLPEKVEQITEALHSQVAQAINEYALYKIGQDEHDGRAFREKRMEANKRMSEMVPPALQALKSEIRSILGSATNTVA